MDWALQPPKQTCTACGCTPQDETDANHPPLDMAVALGIDINWGESLCLCQSCIGHLADLIERPSAVEVQKVKKQAIFQKKRADKAEEKMEKQETLIERIKAGAKATKELRNA